MKYLYAALLTSVSLMLESSSRDPFAHNYSTADRLQAIAGLAALTLLVSPTRTATLKDQDTIVHATQTLPTSYHTAPREKKEPIAVRHKRTGKAKATVHQPGKKYRIKSAKAHHTHKAKIQP